MLRRIRNYFLALVGSKYFAELTVDDLEDLLKRDSIGVNSEIEVFLLVLRWLNLAGDKRLKHLGRLLDCVRFNLMPIAFLWTLRDGFTHPDKDHLFSADPMLLAFNSDPKTETLLTDAMSHVATADSFMGDHNTYLEHMNLHLLPPTYPRKHGYHHKLPYH
ncbi:kelch-like protein 41 [Drosophila guanche]|uniref:kelch-like protein 41 n=1 Tax=Drosophila guanche TaxID=7266 RepID=UPI001470F15E|nr:kelch-like protein 41 [Drosophila guanche]